MLYFHIICEVINMCIHTAKVCDSGKATFEFRAPVLETYMSFPKLYVFVCETLMPQSVYRPWNQFSCLVRRVKTVGGLPVKYWFVGGSLIYEFLYVLVI